MIASVASAPQKQGPPGPLTMDPHADDLVALLYELGVREPVVYVGVA